MTCLELAPPHGLIAFLELIEDLHPLLRSGLRPAQGGTGYPPAGDAISVSRIRSGAGSCLRLVLLLASLI
jgi:hypothetical protein